MILRRAAAVAVLAPLVALALLAPLAWFEPAAATSTTSTTMTTLPSDEGDRSIIPLPGSGREPEDPGDRGGWAQLALFGVMAAGCALIFGRVLWAAHQRSRSSRID